MKHQYVVIVMILLATSFVACDSGTRYTTPTSLSTFTPTPTHTPILIPESVHLAPSCSAKDEISFPLRAIPLLPENIGKATEQKRLSQSSVIQALLSQDGKSLIVASKDNVSIYETKDLSLVHSLASYDATFPPLVAISPNGNILAFNYGFTIYLWPLADDAPVKLINSSTHTMAFSPNNDWLAIGPQMSRIVLINTKDGTRGDIGNSAEQDIGLASCPLRSRLTRCS